MNSNQLEMTKLSAAQLSPQFIPYESRHSERSGLYGPFFSIANSVNPNHSIALQAIQQNESFDLEPPLVLGFFSLLPDLVLLKSLIPIPRI